MWSRPDGPAYAKARPAFPPDAATTPAGPIWPTSAAPSTRLSAPRALKDPVCWRCSSLNQTSVDRPELAQFTLTTGVRRTKRLIRL